ncbi:FaeA/PapI family transcriptional regulator [Paenibacillus sp. UMB7766-LJ446]|uniref:LexA family protein n=1 Tax=Paenibacillus sp. UMB7766-LJ446 TaxID=3046313 RepID=UPI00254ABEE5|nr:FaeA/PapI family transcriptional regulator [Paenibacillus sp. UMB7766-LJ446]MDK8193785.1 FaeA/PapI family transcriptional regulator [Paenibacillus sp. UMB7766-LJ446]
MKKLTRREEEALGVIKDYFRDHGYPPTTRELGDMMGVTSSSTAYGYLKRLEKKGCIKRTTSTPRGIKILEGDRYGR